MFDPTIFDNLKVAFENYLYDLDNMSGDIIITNRFDRMELSTMSREFAIQFTLADEREITAEVVLEAPLKDLAIEILEIPDETPGCYPTIRFFMEVDDVPTTCKHIHDVLYNIWEIDPIQILSFEYNRKSDFYKNTIAIKFNRKINEEQIQEIPNFVDHILDSLEELNEL